MSEKHSVLGNGETLQPGQSLWSPDGSVEFKAQTDGKLCVYWGGECRWQTDRNQRTDFKRAIMQDDGNFVMYTNGDQPMWASNTEPGTPKPGNSTTLLVVQNDGNVVLYNGTPIWSTKSNK